MRDPKLDFVVQGEGELALGEFLSQCAHKRDWSLVPSLAWRRNGEVILNPAAQLVPLTELPDPWEILRGLLDPTEYIATVPVGSAQKVAYVEAGRGCPFACSFCATAPFWQRRYRVKSPHQIEREMRHLYQAGYTRIILVHDLLTANPRFVAELCDVLQESRLPVEWMANSRTDIKLSGLLPRMKSAGCWKLFFGVESASPKVQSDIDKHLSLEDSFNSVAELSRHGITATCSFVIGFPSEEITDAGQSIAAAARLKILGAETVQFHRLRLWPPAPLAMKSCDRAFDELSVSIEHPFMGVTDDEMRQLSSDPIFFGGYFPPNSRLGSPAQISQLEMFAHHAIALAPMTIYLLEDWRPGQIVSAFYFSLVIHGPLRRGSLDWDGGRISNNWRVLAPYLLSIIETIDLEGWQKLITEAVYEYEDRRAEYASAGSLNRNDDLQFVCNVDIPALLAGIRNGISATDEIFGPTTILFKQTPEGFQCFAKSGLPHGRLLDN